MSCIVLEELIDIVAVSVIVVCVAIAAIAFFHEGR